MNNHRKESSKELDLGQYYIHKKVLLVLLLLYLIKLQE